MKKEYRFLNKKPIHLVILLLFTLYLLSANYIFNKLILVKGESKLLDVDVSICENNIMYHIDNIYETKVKWKDLIVINGWAFVKDKKIGDNKSFTVLKSKNNTYIFDSQIEIRRDIPKAFNDYKSELEKCGFSSLISKDLIKNDVYQIGFIIKNNTSSDFILSNDYVTKDKDSFFRGYISKQKSVSITNESEQLNAAIDITRKANINGVDVMQIIGWAFTDEESAINDKTFAVLKSDTNIYVFDTQEQIRKDITDAFSKNKTLNLDNSGFIANIPEAKIEGGKYQIGIYIENGDKKALVYTDKYYEK